ncbi:unnamed protein product [Closterium sp. NIES-53]
MSKVLIAEGLGYNLLSVSQLMAKGIHVEADSTTQEFKLYHGKGGLYIGKAVLKNNVFVLDFVPDLGTTDSDAIVNFADWTHPPDLDPGFSPEGFWYSHTIPEAESTRALATIQHSTAAETVFTEAKTSTPSTPLTTPVASSSTASPYIDVIPPTPTQQLTPNPREVHRSADFTAAFYSNSDLYQRSPGHRTSKDIWHARLGHPSNTVLNNTIRAGVLDKDSLLLTDGSELRRARGTCFTCPEADLPHRPFTSHHNPSAPTYAPLEKVYSDILYNREPGQGAYNYTITFIDAATRYVWHLNLPSKDMAFEAFIAWLPVAERESREKLKSFQSDGGGEYTSQRFKQFLVEKGIKRLVSLPYAHQQQGVAERLNRTLQNTMRKLLRGTRLPNHYTDPHLHAQEDFNNEHIAARDVIFFERLTLPTYLANLAENRDPTGGFRGDRHFASVADEADWDEQNVDNASDEAGPLPYCSVPIPMDDENPHESVNAETYFDLADNGYVTPAAVNTNEAERVGPNFIPDPEEGDEAAYLEDATLPRYTQSGLQILGLVTAYLGLNIEEGENAIYLNAAKYADTIGKRFALTPTTISTPYRYTAGNNKGDSALLKPAGIRNYQKKLGCLLFAAVTCRPDLSYSTSQLATYLKRPETEHLAELDRALHYFVSTPTIGLTYHKNATTPPELIGYVDADHAGDSDNRRSRTGYIYRLEPIGPISWQSSKQELIALSSAEAEYIALCSATKEGLYLRELLEEAKLAELPNFTLFCDNQSAIRIANKSGFANRTKHIALRYFFVKDEIEKGRLKLSYCPTSEMAADYLTKKLGKSNVDLDSCLLLAHLAVLCLGLGSDFHIGTLLATHRTSSRVLRSRAGHSCYVAPGRHRPEHMAAAKRVLRYLCSTSGMGLVLGGRRPVVLTGRADASWADDQATQRSSQGYTFSLGSGSVSWRSTRSSSVLSSSCEAKIYAGAMAAQELRWLTYLLTDLGEQPRSPPVLYVDNKAMLALCREHRLEHRTKHIALRYFLARELQQRGQLRHAYVASEANIADIFTKALAPGDHQRFCTLLGLLALLCLTGTTAAAVEAAVATVAAAAVDDAAAVVVCTG